MPLKVLILSRTSGAYSTQRLKQACVKRGHSPRVFNTLGFSLLLENRGLELFYRGRLVSQYDAVIPRIGASISGFGSAVLRHLEQKGVFALNSAQSIAASRDKLRALQILAGHELPIPATAFVRDRSSVKEAIAQVGGPPIIIKLIEGSQGVGVILADTAKTAEAILETLLIARQCVVVQKYISESRGTDLRALVVGQTVVAAMRRAAAPQEFRTNVHRGGTVEKVRLTREQERVAIDATQTLGLRVAGVDLIESNDGPLVLEVNSSPGLEGIEAATGVDVASSIVEHLEEQIQFPVFDVRQRLTRGGEHDVLELSIQPKSAWVGQTLAALAFEDHELRVLSVTRGRAVHQNPEPKLRLKDGDVLLFFGTYRALSGLPGVAKGHAPWPPQDEYADLPSTLPVPLPRRRVSGARGAR